MDGPERGAEARSAGAPRGIGQLYSDDPIGPSVRFGAVSYVRQDAQLSQRDRAAGCVIVFAKSRTLERGENDLRIL